MNGDDLSNAASFRVSATPDEMAPAAPSQINWMFAGGAMGDFYVVDWVAPVDPSGLARVWWKLGSPPTSPVDGFSLDLPLFKPLPISTLTTNPTSLHLWLEDGAGKKDHARASSVVLFPNAGPPVLVKEPTDVEEIKGSIAAFSVVAGGQLPLGYEWQREDGFVGASSSSQYLSGPLTSGDSGTRYRVVVSNSLGAVTSRWATLTVVAPPAMRWVGAVSTEWDEPRNWSPQRLPTELDAVSIESGVVLLTAEARFGVLTFSGGSLTGTGTCRTVLRWLGGSLGDLNLEISKEGRLSVEGNSDKQLQGAVVRNAGILVWRGDGGITADRGETNLIENLPGGVFEIWNDAIMVALSQRFVGAANLSIYNAGIIAKRGGSGATILTGSIGYSQAFGRFDFVNTGELQVHMGELRIADTFHNHGLCYIGGGSLSLGSGENSGAYVVTDGGLLKVGGGKFREGARFIGPGLKRLAGVFEGLLSGEGLELQRIEGRCTLAGTIRWTAGALTNSEVTIERGALLTIDGGQEKQLRSSVLRNLGTIVWQGAGAIAADSGETNVIENLEGAVFEVRNDSLMWAPYQRLVRGGNLRFDNAGRFVKQGGVGSTVLSGSTMDSGAFGNFWFNNAGVVEVAGGELRIGERFNNSGECRVMGGVLILGDGENAGAYFAGQGGLLHLGGGRFAEGSQLGGPGTKRLIGRFEGALTGEEMEIEGIEGRFTLSGTIRWTAGALTNAEATIGNGAVLTIDGDQEKQLRSSVLRNMGTIVWQGAGTIAADSGETNVIENLEGAVFEVRNDSMMWAPYQRHVRGGNLRFDNAGRFVKQSGVGSTVLSGSTMDTGAFGNFDFRNSGTVEIRSGRLRIDAGFTQTSGEIVLAGGHLSRQTMLHLAGGVLRGSGEVDAHTRSDGEIRPGEPIGSILFAKSLNQSAMGRLVFDIADGRDDSGFDRVVVQERATLAGIVETRFLAGFTPRRGDRFAVLSYGERVGRFSEAQSEILPGPLSAKPYYRPNDLLMVILSPEDTTLPSLRSDFHHDGGLRLTLLAEPQRLYVLEESRDLEQWMPVATNMTVNGLFEFDLPSPSEEAFRFYRAVGR